LKTIFSFSGVYVSDTDECNKAGFTSRPALSVVAAAAVAALFYFLLNILNF
jgi:hypothetical protein